jgi:hypothetical protein
MLDSLQVLFQGLRIDILRLPTLNSEEPIIAPVQTAGELEIIAGGAAQRDDAALHLPRLNLR